MMTDREYEEFLDALARKHLKVHRMASRMIQLREDTERLMSSSRMAQLVMERPEDEYMYRALGKDVEKVPAKAVVDVLRDAGVLAALDEAPELVFSNIRRSAVPSEDLDMIRRAGVNDPEAELTIVIYQAREFPGKGITPSKVAAEAVEKLERVGHEMQSQRIPPRNEKIQEKKRKILNGIGNLLVGLVTGGGNILLTAGAITVPNPALGYTVLGSAAVAIGSLFKGLGDLRGE